MTITLRLLEHRDINLLRELRNANREWFFSTRLVTANQQEEWWEDYQGELNFVVYAIQSGPTTVGFISVRSDWEDTKEIRGGFGVCEVGNLLVAPAYRGQGVMTEALCEVRRLWPGCFWIAHVKPDNAASLRLFKKAGFWRVPNA